MWEQLCVNNTFLVHWFLNNRLECILDDFSFNISANSKLHCQLNLSNYKLWYNMTYASLSDPPSGKELDILDIPIRLGALEKSSIAKFWKFNGKILRF